jgi:predicted acylesterase/phospholipase RssA
VLDELGLLKGLKRVAGTSAGSIIAMALAVKMDPKDIREAIAVDMESLVKGRARAGTYLKMQIVFT